MLNIEEIHNKAIFLDELNKNEKSLFDFINSKDCNYEEILEKYNPQKYFQPVNTLRFLIANELRKGNVVDNVLIENLKEAIENRDVSMFFDLPVSIVTSLKAYKKSKMGMFPNWKQAFKILFPFVHNDSENESVKIRIAELTNDIIEQCGLTNVKAHNVSFLGANNYGTNHIWGAIIPETTPSVQYSYQIFFMITKDGLYGGLHKGHNINNSDFSLKDIPFNKWKDFIKHAKEIVPEWKSLNESIDFLLVKDENAFRLSIKNTHPNELRSFFTILDKLKSDLSIQDEERLVFSVANKNLSFHIGKRYCLKIEKKQFGFISYNELSLENKPVEDFSTSHEAFFYKNCSAKEVLDNYEELKDAVELEIDRDNHSEAKKYDNSAFRKAFFDLGYRMKMLEDSNLLNQINIGNNTVYKISMGQEYFSDEDIEKAIQDEVAIDHSTTKPQGRSKISQADIFSNEMKIGDYIYITHSNINFKALGMITSNSVPTSFNDMGKDGWLERSFKLICRASKSGKYEGKKKLWAPNGVSTCWGIKKDELNEANERIFKPFFNTEFLAMDNNNIELNVINDFTPPPLNQILYGPPGTGKTYNTILEAAKIVKENNELNYKEAQTIFNEQLGKQIEFITFHQNYSYEDFIQGLRPETEGTGQLSFFKSDGVFKKIADRALKNLKESENPVLAKKEFDTVFKELVKPLLEGDKEELEVEMKKTSFYITEIGEKSIEFRKNQGDSKHTLSISTLKKMYEMGSNEIILGGLQPYYNPILNVLLEKGKTNLEPVLKKNYVIIIDEINRANISRVFGELITLIEKDKRSHGDLPISATLPSGEKFIVPSNLFIIGTMNTADKSIALLDIALRRRFEFIPKYPQYEIIKDGKNIVNDSDILRKINDIIIAKKGHDFTIGHSYFMGDDYSFENTINNKVLPLLIEYFMNNIEEVKKIMNEANVKVDGWPLKLVVND